MKISLVHYDVTRIANEPGNITVMKHFGHMPNIQLLYVAAILEQIGVEIQYIDPVGMGLGQTAMESSITSFKPDIIGMSVFTSHYHNAKSYARRFKSLLPDVKILVGGVHMQIYPVETLQYCSDIDYGCVGEAEMVLPEMIRRLVSNETLSGLKGVVWRDGDRVCFEGPAPMNLEPDSIPFPARHLVPNDQYYNFISTKRNYTVFNTSRGCPYRCIFCESARTQWRARSPENIVAEFEACHEDFNIREVDIFDSSFTVSKKRVIEICRLLCQRGLHRKMIWNVRSRVDTIDVETLEALAEAGCYRIFYGIESADQQVLLNLRKQITAKRVIEIINMTKKVGISTFGYFLVGSPGDTPDTIRSTIDFAKKLPLDFAIFNCLTAFPKTELYDKYYLPNADHDFWADYLQQDRSSLNFMGRPWSEIPNEDLQKIAHKAMLEFYFRPVAVYRTLTTIGSMEQLKRYFMAALDMSMDYLKRTRTKS